MAVNFNSYMPTIWNYLMGVIGNEYGVAGLMGNLYAESGCNPRACEPSRPTNVCNTYIANVDSGAISRAQFIGGGCSPTGGYISSPKGFGLAQWTSTNRKAGLYDVAPVSSLSIGDLGRQLSWLSSELNGGYSSTLAACRNAKSVKEASDYVLVHFEAPLDQSDAVKRIRAGYGQEIYNRYAGDTPSEYKTIYAEVEGNGQVTPASAQARTGETVSFLASPLDEDTFINWTLDAGDATINDTSAETIIVTVGQLDSTITAHFTGETPEKTTHTITIIDIGRGQTDPQFVEGEPGESFHFDFIPRSRKYYVKEVELASGDCEFDWDKTEGIDATMGAEDSVLYVYWKYRAMFPGLVGGCELVRKNKLIL